MKNRKIEIKWAIYFSIMTLCWMLLEKFAGLHGKYLDYQLYLTNLFAIPAIWMMTLALKEKKLHFYSGNISYQQGLISGIILSALIALLSPITQWITSYIITPEYFPNVIKRSVELGYYKTTEEAAANFNYQNYAIQSTIFAFVFGLLTSAIIMLFLKTKTSQNGNH